MSFSSIPLRNNGEQIFNTWFNTIRTEGIAIEASIAAVFSWTKYTISHVDLKAAALTNSTTVLTLPIKGIIEGIVVKTATAFAGTSITSYKIDVGIVGELDRYLSQYNAMTAVAESNYSIQDVKDIPSFSGTTAIKIQATAIGANLINSTAGSIDIWIKTATLT